MTKLTGVRVKLKTLNLVSTNNAGYWTSELMDDEKKKGGGAEGE